MDNNANVITFGCRLNFWESKKISEKLKEAQAKNIAVFNTCSVTNEAVRSTVKAIKSFHNRNPDIKIAVTGCAVESDFELFKNMNEVSVIVKNAEKIASSSWNFINFDSSKIPLHPLDMKQQLRQNPSNSSVRKFVRIQNGCNHACTFCIIPSCRGKSVSTNFEMINKEIKNSLNAGIREIILTGVDITAWGTDLKEKNDLGFLVKSILSKNPNLMRLRLSSIDIAEIDNNLIECIKNDSRLMPHFHLSVQSLDDMILKRMKRRHNTTDVRKLFDKIRKANSNATFGADLISGFPTETEKMFTNTLNNLEDLEISHLHVFPYSSKIGTPASKMPQVPINIRRTRAKILREKGNQIYKTKLRQQLRIKHKALIENDRGVGKTENNFEVELKNFKKGDIVLFSPDTIENNKLTLL